MSSHATDIDFEPVIWARLIEAQEAPVSAEVARYLLGIEFGETDRLRMSELAERSKAGTLTPEDQVEFDSYLHVGNLLAVMQSKARIALNRKLPESSRS